MPFDIRDFSSFLLATRLSAFFDLAATMALSSQFAFELIPRRMPRSVSVARPNASRMTAAAAEYSGVVATIASGVWSITGFIALRIAADTVPSCAGSAGRGTWTVGNASPPRATVLGPGMRDGLLATEADLRESAAMIASASAAFASASAASSAMSASRLVRTRSAGSGCAFPARRLASCVTRSRRSDGRGAFLTPPSSRFSSFMRMLWMTVSWGSETELGSKSSATESDAPPVTSTENGWTGIHRSSSRANIPPNLTICSSHAESYP